MQRYKNSQYFQLKIPNIFNLNRIINYFNHILSRKTISKKCRVTIPFQQFMKKKQTIFIYAFWLIASDGVEL